MTWEDGNARLALLEILVRGALRRRQGQAEAYTTLSELPWTRLTGRRDEIRLVEGHRQALVTLLDRVWPEWPAVLADLTAAGLPPTPAGHAALLERVQAAELQPLPARINRRTAAALTAPHSKATLTKSRRGALGATRAVHDGAIRLRPPAGLAVRTATGYLGLDEVAAVLGEVSIPQRAFLDGLEFEQLPRVLLTVENLGAWRDLPQLPGWLLAHVPGWDTTVAASLVAALPGVPTVHFGDLDPNGVRIVSHLRERVPNLKWLVPDFWFELAPSAGLKTAWPADLDLGFAPAVVRDLAARGLWLEQERIVLDPRLPAVLEQLVEDVST